MRIHIYAFFFMLAFSGQAKADERVDGQVLSKESSKPIAGATIKVKGTNLIMHSDINGYFYIPNLPDTFLLQISCVGFKPQELTISKRVKDPVLIYLVGLVDELEEVVVSTGYQKIAKERVTGSFVHLDNNILNRSTSTDILSRLEDVTSGLIFNKSNASNDPISIRGRSTIYANAKPLIVIDNFPYEGDILNINPNDVESVTVLKDAAAASIWGARAGNGVIVISTKKGGRGPAFSFNSNVTIGDKPDQFYLSTMKTSDFIEVEKLLFANDFYKSKENSLDNKPLTPVVELLIRQRDGTLSSFEVENEIEKLKLYDIRRDIDQYLNQKSINQQYSFSLQGSSSQNNYFFSMGYDKDIKNLVGNDYSRLTFNGKNTYSLFEEKLQLTTGVNYTHSNALSNSPGTVFSVRNGPAQLPYAQLADENGHPLPIIRDYRTSFVDESVEMGKLPWQYNPLEEVQFANNRTESDFYRLNGEINYKISSQISAELLYQYSNTGIINNNLQSQESYYTRNIINNFSQIVPGHTDYIVPLGSILDNSSKKLQSQFVRAQLNYSNNFNDAHSLNAIVGFEGNETISKSRTSRLYGYDEEHILNKTVDYENLYPQFYYPGASSRISNMDRGTELNDRNRSYYFNMSYAYLQRFILSGSARIDQSNLFGVKINQKSIPLWSSGFLWEVDKEQFYNLEFLPKLKFRFTYGYNGNIDKTVSAYTTATYLSSAYNTGLPYAQIRSAANPELRWERVEVTNLGLDFAFKKNIVSGSIEYYNKKGIDLIGDMNFAPSTGIVTLKGNFANTIVKGVDISLTTRNIDRAIKWNSNILLSINKDRVTNYSKEASATSYVSSPGYPLVNRPLFSYYSYAWAGLDRENGDPLGFLDGELSKNYSSIISKSNSGNIIYNGPSRPTVYGSFRNTVIWRSFSLSANVSFRFGYYYRQPSVNYAAILNGNGGHGDYAFRWERTGDEQITQIPSMPISSNTARDNFYLRSEALIKRADNIRLKDIRLDFIVPENYTRRTPFKLLKIYAFADNLGVLWKKTKSKIDPDFPTSIPSVKTIALGANITF